MAQDSDRLRFFMVVFCKNPHKQIDKGDEVHYATLP